MIFTITETYVYTVDCKDEHEALELAVDGPEDLKSYYEIERDITEGDPTS